MVVNALEQRWEILRHYFENHANVTEYVRKLRTGFWKKKSTVNSVCSLSCEKSAINWHLHR